MIDLVKKSFLTGVGLAVLTKDRVEEMAAKMARESNATESEGKKFVDEMISRADEYRGALEKMIGEKVNAALGAMNIPTREEIAALERRIAALEARTDKES
jgi:polyhydroxyalkanoate synthesis regulator phasin